MPKLLTVILRNEGPLHINEPCSYRRVSLTLTDEQRMALELRSIGSLGTEQVSSCFLEFGEATK